jgi:hypothetical protein
MGKISENVDLDENLREMCLEIVTTLIEAMPKLISDSKDGSQKLENFVTKCIHFL